MKTTLTVAILISIKFLSGTVTAGEGDRHELTAGADMVSRYIWRGINLGGPSPHIQPAIELAAADGKLAIGFWGSYGIGQGGTGTEADLYISYSPVSLFTFTLTDYYFPSDNPFSSDGYFNYNREDTGHTIEGMASFNGTESFPLSVLFAINIYGADGTDGSGEKYHAKYLELGYSTSFRDFEIGTFAGMALDNPGTGPEASGWYGESRGVINLGVTLTKNIRFTETVAIPAFSSLIFNPEAGNVYMVLGLTL